MASSATMSQLLVRQGELFLGLVLLGHGAKPCF